MEFYPETKAPADSLSSLLKSFLSSGTVVKVTDSQEVWSASVSHFEQLVVGTVVMKMPRCTHLKGCLSQQCSSRSVRQTEYRRVSWGRDVRAEVP